MKDSHIYKVIILLDTFKVIKTKDNPKDVANAYNCKMPFYFIIIKIYGIMDNMEDSHTLKQY